MLLQYIIKLIYFKTIYTLSHWQFNKIAIFSDEKYLLLLTFKQTKAKSEKKGKMFKENFNTELNLC